MSIFSDFFGTTPMNYDFSFNRQDAQYNTNPDLLASISQLRGVGGQARSASNRFMDITSDMLDPNSIYNQGQYNLLRNQLGDAEAGVVANQNAALASRGIGQGGLANLLGSAASNRTGEQARQGMLGIQQQSLGAAGQFGGLATNALGTAGNIFGQAGQLTGDVDARRLQTELANVQSQNEYNQYLRMSRYNQEIENRNRQGNFANSLLSLAGGIGGAMLGGPIGASLGASLFGGMGSSSMPIGQPVNPYPSIS
jgi:hypothetical protein